MHRYILFLFCLLLAACSKTPSDAPPPKIAAKVTVDSDTYSCQTALSGSYGADTGGNLQLNCFGKNGIADTVIYFGVHFSDSLYQYFSTFTSSYARANAAVKILDTYENTFASVPYDFNVKLSSHDSLVLINDNNWQSVLPQSVGFFVAYSLNTDIPMKQVIWTSSFGSQPLSSYITISNIRVVQDTTAAGAPYVVVADLSFACTLYNLFTGQTKPISGTATTVIFSY